MEIELADSTELTVQKSGELAPQSEMNSLLQMAVDKDIDVEKLEKLIDLKDREDSRMCKKDFDFHFSEMQSEFNPVKKDKDGSKTDKGVVAFRYAPLENYQETNGGIISKHHFSYKWTEETLDNGMLRVRIHISGYGHTDDSTYNDVPPIDTNRLTTAVQAQGARKGYGRRITFADGFGMTVIGQDTDGEVLTFKDGIKYGEYQLLFDTCATLDDLKEAYKYEYEKLGADMEGKKVLAMLKDKRKKEIGK